jgi:uncharacterized membrane protein
MVGLGGLPLLPDSEAFGVSGNGSTIVGASGSHPFLWTQENGMQALPGLAGSDETGTARAISADGSVIVGTSANPMIFNRVAVRWTNNSGPQPLDSISNDADFSEALAVSADGSVIVGHVYRNSHFEAFRWSEVDGALPLGALPGHRASSYAIVSGDGKTIAGRSNESLSTITDAFMWRENLGMTLLASRPEGIGQLEPRAMSFDGSVIVGIMIEEDPTWYVHPFIWSIELGLRDLEEYLLYDLGVDEVADWNLGHATGISANGRVIVGYGGHAGEPDQQAWIAVIPEPSTLCLFSIVAWSVVRRRLTNSSTKHRRKQ